jgi:hypothetical protein
VAPCFVAALSAASASTFLRSTAMGSLAASWPAAARDHSGNSNAPAADTRTLDKKATIHETRKS